MKIINKSGTANTGPGNEVFYIVLVQGSDQWEYNEFRFDMADKYSSEEAAVEDANPGDVIARVELVAKIV